MFRTTLRLSACFACLLLPSLQVLSQELFFSSLTSEVQLPSLECYKILQDKEGYIWFSTDNGLCRYGGNELKVFNKKNGLPEENVYVICEDKQGKTWFATSKNRILYYENGQLKEASFSKAYQKVGPEHLKNPIPYSMDLNDPENSNITNSYFTTHINQSKKQVSQVKFTNPDVFYLITKKAGSPFISIPAIATRNDKLWKEPAILLKNETQSKKIFLPELNKKLIHRLIPTTLAGNTDFIGVQNQLIRVNPDLTHTIQSFPDRILSLYTDKSNGLWVGVLNHGVYYYPDVTTMQLRHHSLRKYSVSSICEDHEHGIWCATLEKGIQYSRSKYVTAYTAMEGFNQKISLLKYFLGNLYISSSGDQLFVHHSANQFSVHSFPLGKETFFTDLLPYNNYWFLSSKEIMVRTNQQFRSVKLLHSSNSTGAAYQLTTYQNKLYGVMYSYLYEVNDSQTIMNRINIFPFRSKSILNQGEGHFLLGGDQGLYSYDLKTGKYKQIKNIPEKVTGLLKSRTGRIWVITADDDIYWIDGSKVISAGKQLNLKKSTLYDITEDRYGTIWVASNEGLLHFAKQGNTYKSAHYTIHNGLPSNEVYKVAADNESIWFSTFEGLFSLPLRTDVKNRIGPSIHLQKMTVNNHPSKNAHSIKLTSEQNDLHFTFDILTFKTGMLNKLTYILSSESENRTVDVNGNEVFLENLSPGSYQFVVYGINNDGIKSPQPEVFQIVIAAPFWQTWWFITSAILLIGLFVTLLVRLITRNIRKAEEAKTLINKMMAEYQITALQAQMNPHFIFNAINTIQGYILGKNEAEAYNYLAKFSKLIRMVLHHSQLRVLRLERELEVLGLYIELEQLRFDHCFDYELVVATDTKITDFNIPGMLLQPYVENAIWHGIVNLENSRRGKLVISIEHLGEQLLIRITDNGVGREKAKSFRENTYHKSVGMKLTGERLEVMNQLHGQNTASVHVKDLMSEEGDPSGTQVEISIPINI